MFMNGGWMRILEEAVVAHFKGLTPEISWRD
jgi:hypothetical protein